MSSSSYPPIPPSKLNDEQKRLQAMLDGVTPQLHGDPSPFEYKNSEGAYIGPFIPLFYTPSLAESYFNFVKAVGSIPGLPPKARELVILAVGSVYEAAYLIYAHERVAANVGLSESQIQDAKTGKRPQDLDEQGACAYDVALGLARGAGPMSGETMQRAQKAFGKEGTLALINYVGTYAFTSIVLNACACEVPGQENV